MIIVVLQPIISGALQPMIGGSPAHDRGALQPMIGSFPAQHVELKNNVSCVCVCVGVFTFQSNFQ